MSILNYGLQNCATERAKIDEESEKLVKRANSMAQLRIAALKQPQLVGKCGGISRASQSIDPK